MKALSDTAPAPKSAQDLQKALRHGLTTTDGGPITRNPPGVRIQDQQSLTAIRSLMRRSEPNSNYEIIRHEGSMQRRPLPKLEPFEMETAEFHKRPAASKTINEHLKRLAMHKRMDRNDPERDAYLFADFTRRLDGVTEVEIFTACQHFIEKDPSPFFPTFGAMNEFLKDQFENSKWSKFYSDANKRRDENNIINQEILRGAAT